MTKEQLIEEVRKIIASHDRYDSSDAYRVMDDIATLMDRESVAVESTLPPCDHSQWSFARHGRICPCGTMMRDFGD